MIRLQSTDTMNCNQQDFDKFKNDEINILEIGTSKVKAPTWLDYFSQAKIYTADTFERVVQKSLH